MFGKMIGRAYQMGPYLQGPSSSILLRGRGGMLSPVILSNKATMLPRLSTSAPRLTSEGDGASSSSSSSSQGVQRYPKGLAWFHWFGAAGICFLMGSAFVAGRIKKDDPATTKEQKKFRDDLMHLHESVGLLMFAMIIPRIGLRLMGPKVPPPLPVPGWQQMASKVTHGLLYGAMVFMPVSGLAFGYFSCWGVPFFKWYVPGAPKEKYGDTYKALEKFFYENHHNVGHYLTYYIFPIHIAAVLFNTFVRKNGILGRMNPFPKRS